MTTLCEREDDLACAQLTALTLHLFLGVCRELLVHSVHVWSTVTDDENLHFCNVCVLPSSCAT